MDKMFHNVVILENIRSAYNVGNIVRTADSLGRDVWIVGYTPSPLTHPKVLKTSLGAEQNVGIKQFDFSNEAISYAKSLGMQVIAAELTENAKDLGEFKTEKDNIAIIFWNEVEGVLENTLKEVDTVVKIPMQWIKESMNVGQSTAIFMRELRKKIDFNS